MHRLLLLFTFLTIHFLSFSQYSWDYGAGLGASNYLGEMGGNAGSAKGFLSDLKLSQTRFSGNAFLRYKIFQWLAVKGSVSYVRIAGADSLSANYGRIGRNLSFRNDIIEAALNAQLFFFDIPDLGGSYRYRNDFRAYMFAGVAEYYSDPKANYNGQWIALRPLKTEGVPYSATGFTFPVGIGFFFTLEKKLRLGWELSWRKTFSDYLDDVSTTYVDPSTFEDPMAIILANRSADVTKDDPIYAKQYEPGQKRGNSKDKDSYITTTINLSYVMRGKSSFYRSHYGSVFGGKKFKKRRIRAKF